jgi:hypothetical protein
MRKAKILKGILCSLTVALISLLGWCIVSVVIEKKPIKEIADLFVQNQLEDYRNVDAGAYVNGIPIPKNLIEAKKAIGKAVTEFSNDNKETLQELFGMESVLTSDEEIVRDVAKRILFIEYAKKQGIIVEQAEVDAYLINMCATNKQNRSENSTDALSAKQFDEELLSAMGLTEQEFDEYFLKEQITYALYSQKYALALSADTHNQNPKSIDSICNELLSEAEIVYQQ